MRLSPGPVDLDSLVPDPSGWLGLLILDGLLVVELDSGRARVGELLGAEDLVDPWQMRHGPLTRTTAWRAVTDVQVALLDADFASRAAAIPGVPASLLAYAQRSARWLLAKSLVLSSPIVEERIMLLFALLGERWGTVNCSNVRLVLPLTHDQIARLVGARRPTVSSVLKDLHDKGVLVCEQRHVWRLCRDGATTRPLGWEQFADALGWR